MRQTWEVLYIFCSYFVVSFLQGMRCAGIQELPHARRDTQK